MTKFIVDCDTCVVRGNACGDCAISALLGDPESSGPTRISEEERRALSLFAGAGMLPPLRLVRPLRGEEAAFSETISQEIGQIRWG